MAIKSYVPQAKAVIGGASRLLVAAFATNTRTEYATALRRIVTGLDPAPDWFCVGALPLPEGSTWQQPAQGGVGAGYTPTVTVPFAGLSGLQRESLLALAAPGLRLWALVQDKAGNWWLLGETRGLKAAVASSGGSGSDAQGETLALSGNEPTLARQFTPATALALYAAAYAAFLLDGGDTDTEPAPEV